MHVIFFIVKNQKKSGIWLRLFSHLFKSYIKLYPIHATVKIHRMAPPLCMRHGHTALHPLHTPQLPQTSPRLLQAAYTTGACFDANRGHNTSVRGDLCSEESHIHGKSHPIRFNTSDDPAGCSTETAADAAGLK